MTDTDLEIAYRRITKLESAAAAAAAGYPGDRMLIAAIADRLVATVRGNEVSVRVRGDDGRFRPLTSATEFAQEIVRDNPGAFKPGGTKAATPAEGDRDGGYTGLTRDMLQKKKLHSAAALTDADRAAARASNPWCAGATWNLTTQMTLTKAATNAADRAFVAELRKAAGLAE